MANSKARRHTHKYYKCYRFKGSNEFLWTCALPDCSHHMPKHMESMLKNKATLCWGCDEPMVLDDRTWKMDKPLCSDCDPAAVDISTMDPDVQEKLREMGIIGKLD